MNKVTIALLALGAMLASCGDKSEKAARSDAPAVSEADEAHAQREADENRKRFMGDGKARYTPQRVEEF
ncbi:hypothetical protein N5C72_22575 [Achromobacter mucicolens]|uniref:Lipoprotein n=1 Tax=Achromobacter mucicolens TaxID=1389922 RepID=A0ABD4Z0G4_9BURK|nr:hypothetical protein [Achromobacter mucicolens]MDH1180876.1 hypothetical protein [Achromobacter mucicolens]